MTAISTPSLRCYAPGPRPPAVHYPISPLPEHPRCDGVPERRLWVSWLYWREEGPPYRDEPVIECARRGARRCVGGECQVLPPAIDAAIRRWRRTIETSIDHPGEYPSEWCHPCAWEVPS